MAEYFERAPGEEEKEFTSKEIEERHEKYEKEIAEQRAYDREHDVKIDLLTYKFDDDPWDIYYIEIDGVTHKVKMRNRPHKNICMNIILGDPENNTKPHWVIPAFGATHHYFEEDWVDEGYFDDICCKYGMYKVLVLGNDKERTARYCYKLDKKRTTEYIITNDTNSI